MRPKWTVCVSLCSLPFHFSFYFLVNYFFTVNQLLNVKHIFHQGFGQVTGLPALWTCDKVQLDTKTQHTQRQFAWVCHPGKILGLVLLKAEHVCVFRVRCYDDNFFERLVQDLGHSFISFQCYCYYHYYYYSKTSFSYITFKSVDFQLPWMNEGVSHCSAIPVLG